MELQIYLSFAAATILMISFPGPSVILTIAHSISFGWRRALMTVAGETAGIAVQLIIAVVGLTSLLNTAANVFEWIRWLGAAYLVYLGIKQWLDAGKPMNFDISQTPGKKLFIQGLVITVPNPKSLIFIAAFLPQFIDTTRPLNIQFAFIVPTFLAITFIVTSIWAFAAGKARKFLQSPRALKIALRIAGIMMVLAGIGLALAHPSS